MFKFNFLLKKENDKSNESMILMKHDIFNDDYPFFGFEALKLLLNEYEFNTVLDLGCGEGRQCDVFLDFGKNVTCIDIGKSTYFEKNKHRINTVIDDFNKHDFKEQFDCVWCCHVLEHQLNVNIFLTNINKCLKENGILAITVPPKKDEVVGGHVTIWNAGLLLYNLVLAGFNCKNAKILQYGYNVSVVLKKEKINVLDSLVSDAGDIKKIREFLPEGLNYNSNPVDTPFDGNIVKLNWD